jgi:hypothetical protein
LRKHLYFLRFVAQFNGSMTRFLILTSVLLAAQLSARADGSGLAKTSVLESDVVYLRVANIEKSLPAEIRSAQGALSATNQIAGMVLDLRSADGADLDSAKAVADWFASKKLPLAILVNPDTRGAAIALTKELRAAHTGLVFGNATEVRPDVSVLVDIADEKSFLENPYGAVSTNDVRRAMTTNDFLPVIDHTSEADLVRARIKDGEEDQNLAPERALESAGPFIRDPVLVRGTDFIKGLAVLRLSHS